jgi:hypothetical protein
MSIHEKYVKYFKRKSEHKESIKEREEKLLIFNLLYGQTIFNGIRQNREEIFPSILALRY